MDKTNDQMAQQIKSETIVLGEKASKQQMALEEANNRQGGTLETITYDCYCKKNQEKAINNYKQKVMI